jgi:hypothetical protein
VLKSKYDQITVRVQRSKKLYGSSKAETIFQQDKRRTWKHSAMLSFEREVEEKNGVERKDETTVTLFFSRTEQKVSHWQAACESGRVWLRLLQEVAVTKLAGFRMR